MEQIISNQENGILSKMKKWKLDKILLVAFLFVLALGYVYLYSISTSPRYPNCFGHDSAQFQTMGMAWSKGYIPYRDLFDHKGPYIFFVNLIGYHLGFLYMQAINMTVVLYFIYKITVYLTNKWYVGFASVFFFLFTLYMPYCDGNYTEEYCMPFLFSSFYLALRSIREEEYKIRNVILYGITAGICLMTRATNFLPIAMCILVIIGLLIIKKDYMNILYSGLVFLGSMMLVVGPFAIYFASKGQLYGLLNGSILYNFKYITSSTPWVTENNSWETINNFILVYISIFLMVIPIAFAETLRERILYILLPTTELALFCYGIFFYHYPMIALFQVALFVSYIFNGLLNKKRRVVSLIVGALVVLYYCRFELYAFCVVPSEYLEAYGTYQETDYEILANETDDDFVGVGSERMKDIYLRTDSVPCVQFFSIQDWHASFDEETRQLIRQDYLDGKVPYVIAEETQYETIRDIMQENYDLIDSRGTYKLYKLRK